MLGKPVSCRNGKARLAASHDRLGEGMPRRECHELLAVAMAAGQDRGSNLAQEEGVDERDAHLEGVRHRAPVDVAQELVAHEERRLERGHAGEGAAGVGRDGLADVVEDRQPPQALLGQLVAEDQRQLVGEEEPALHEVRAFIGMAVLRRERRLRTEARPARNEALVEALVDSRHSRQVTEDGGNADEAGDGSEGGVAAEQLVAAGGGEGHLPSQLGGGVAHEVRVDGVGRGLIHGLEQPRQLGAELVAGERDVRVLRSILARDGLRKRRLVLPRAGVFVEPQGDALQRHARLRGQGHDRSGVASGGEERADRHVAHEVIAHRLANGIADDGLPLCLRHSRAPVRGLTPRLGDREVRARLAGTRGSDLHPVSGRQCADGLVHGERLGHPASKPAAGSQHGLVGAMIEIDDGQAPVAECDMSIRREPRSGSVGTSGAHRVTRADELFLDGRLRRGSERVDCVNAAHSKRSVILPYWTTAPRMKEKRDIYRFLHVSPRRIFEQLDQYVVGQRQAKEVLAIAAYNHLKRIEYLKFGGEVAIRKSNILMIGPSGSGKTYLARTLARILDVPFAYNDATAFTEAGYYGEDVELAIGRLLYATNQNVDAAENGVVFVDEIDKLARRAGGARTGNGARDIGGEGVQQSLLKILEGEKLFVPLNGAQHWSKHDFVELDLANILFICAGSFSDVDVTPETKPIGFFGDAASAHELSTDDLVNYGFLPELLGRLPVRVQLDQLTAEELVTILTEPREAMVPEYQRLCALDQIQLDFSHDALYEIANAALKQKLGARALRAILEKVLHPILFVGPERAGERIVIESEHVRRYLA